jgi:hypothetical protein
MSQNESSDKYESTFDNGGVRVTLENHSQHGVVLCCDLLEDGHVTAGTQIFLGPEQVNGMAGWLRRIELNAAPQVPAKATSGSGTAVSASLGPAEVEAGTSVKTPISTPADAASFGDVDELWTPDVGALDADHKCCMDGKPVRVDPCASCPQHPINGFRAWLDTYGYKAAFDRGDMAACWYAARRALRAASATAFTTPHPMNACRAPSSVFTIGFASKEWYCGGCGANQAEPECRYLKSTPPEAREPKDG